MRLLLDTNVVLWAVGAPARLGASLSTIGDPSNERVLSAVVVWEVAIKHGLGRLDLDPPDVASWARRAQTALVAEGLAISAAHAAAVGGLPPHHRDPFDRMLVVQAQALGATVVTADATLARYDVDVLLVG